MRIALFENSANFWELGILSEEDWQLELNFISKEQFGDCLFTQFDRNQTFHEQDANDDRVFFAKSNWNPTET